MGHPACLPIFHLTISINFWNCHPAETIKWKQNAFNIRMGKIMCSTQIQCIKQISQTEKYIKWWYKFIITGNSTQKESKVCT